MTRGSHGAVGALGTLGTRGVVEVTRTIVAWCPDWPVSALIRDRALPPTSPVALVLKGEVFACSGAARKEGVSRGLRIREAQSRCPDLLVFPYDAALDVRSFDPVISAIDTVMPGVQLLRPGMCAIRSRGPKSFYGSDEEAALWLLDTLDEQGITDARVGIADGLFAAEQAARKTSGPRIRIIPAGESPGFLAPMPINSLDAPSLATLLQRLGIRTLGQFAALTPDDVAARFGQEGAHLHALASGLDRHTVIPRIPPQELDSVIEFEPPLDRIDQVAFGFRAAADRFIAAITGASLVVTSIRVEIDSDSGETSERTWLHPRSFTSADVIDRIRWQLQGGGAESGLGSPVSYVRVSPEAVDAIGHHEQGLWGTAADERIHHGLSRVQSMLGHGGVLTGVVGGGRSSAERATLVAWGDRPLAARSPEQPWAGTLPTPAPSTVFESRHPVSVVDAAGNSVTIDDRGNLSNTPAAFSTGGEFCSIGAWAGPWPIDERWWDEPLARHCNRFQVVDGDGLAWLLVLDTGSWWAEARYD